MAELLQPRLNDRPGPVPQVPRIMAAILVARDSLSARAARRAVEGVPDGAHSAVTRLAGRLRALIDRDASAGAQHQESPAPQPPAPQPSAAVVRLGHVPSVTSASEHAAVESAGIGLPPLAAVPMPAPPLTLPEPVPPPPHESFARPRLQDPPLQAVQVPADHVMADAAHCPDPGAEHALDAAAALDRLSAWSEQLPDQPRGAGDGSWGAGRSVWDGSQTAADLEQQEGCKSSSKRSARAFEIERRVAEKRAAERRTAERYAAERREAEKRAAERREAEAEAEQRAWNNQYPGAMYDYDLYLDRYG